MCEGNIPTVEGRIMYKAKASALSIQDGYYIVYCLSTLTSPVMHRQLISKGFSALTDLRQLSAHWAPFKGVTLSC